MWATFPTSLFLLFLAVLPSVFSQDGCSQWLHPRKHVVCYFEGKRSVASLNACLCTHLIYTNVGLNADAKLDITNDIESDLEALRYQNPRLKVLASLGGEAVKASTFSSFITERESLNNLTSSINAHYRSGLLDGVEIDWEWPFQEGGKKDRIKLIRYARQIKIAVGEEVVTRRARNRQRLQRRDTADSAEALASITEQSNQDYPENER